MKIRNLIILIILAQTTMFSYNLLGQGTLDFVGSPRSGIPPLTVQFTASVTLPGTINSIYWSFGDGGTSYTLNPRHTYTSVDTYSVYLRVYTTFARGEVWKFNYIRVSSPVAVEEPNQNEKPAEFRLHQNYPNPFNPETTIEYQLPKVSEVNIQIFNIRGYLIKTLVVNEKQNAGSYLIVWGGKDESGKEAPSGTYFYRIETEGFTQTKKMTLLR